MNWWPGGAKIDKLRPPPPRATRDARCCRNLAYSFVTEIILMVLICYCPGVQDVFGTTAFPGRFIGMAIVIIPIMVAFEETRKWFARTCVRRRAAACACMI